MKKTTKTQATETPTPRNAIAVMMMKRFGGGTRIMKHKTAPKKGAKRPDHHEGW